MTVQEMLDALSKLPKDAELIITESGYYSDCDYTEAYEPEQYQDTNKYVIGHSHQSY